jgi:hypothetical protein
LKITALEESTDFATLDTEKLFSKLKSHKFSRKGRPNHDASLYSKGLIASARVGGHDANTTNTTVSSALEFILSSLAAVSDEQYESILDDEITLSVRKFRALHKFLKERRGLLRGLLRVQRHHPLCCRLHQEEEARLLLQVQLQRSKQLQQQGRGQEEVPLQG